MTRKIVGCTDQTDPLLKSGSQIWSERDEDGSILTAIERHCAVMRELSERIPRRYGTESDQYYRFLEAVGKFERLVDSIPGAREAVLESMMPVWERNRA